MDLKTTMIAWTPSAYVAHPTARTMMLGPHPDYTGWSNAYVNTSGAAYAKWRSCTPARRKAMMMKVFIQIIADGCYAVQAYDQFMQFPEFHDVVWSPL